MLGVLLQLTPEIQSNMDLVSVVSTLITGMAASWRYYKRTGNIPFKKLPWRSIRRVFYTVRATVFTFDAPPEKTAIDGTLQEFEGAIGKQSYIIDWPFSYHYKGEDVNAARYYYDPSKDHPHRQVHIRAWVDEDGTTTYAHDEPSAIHHIGAHLRGVDMDDVTEWVADNWSDEDGLDPRNLPD